MFHGATKLRGVFRVLLACVLGVVGCVSVSGATYTYQMRVHNAGSVSTFAGAAAGGDSGNQYWSCPAGIAVGAYSSFANVNVVADGTPVQARCKATAGGSYGGFVSIGVVSSGGANQFTVEWDGSNAPGGATNYYTLCICYTNRTGEWCFWSPDVYYNLSGTWTFDHHILTPDPTASALAPGAFACICVTNTQPFALVYGCTQTANDNTRYQTTANTNASYSPPGSGQGGGSATPGPVTGSGNQANGGGGTGAGGGTNAATQHDIFTGSDAVISAGGENTQRIIDELERIRTNSLSVSSGDYSNVLNQIKTNTDRGQLFANYQWQLFSNELARASSNDADATNRAIAASSVASNLLSSIGFFNLDYSSYTGAVGSLVYGFLGGGGVPGSGYGVLTVTSGASGVANTVLDFASAFDGTSFNPYLGSGWRTWFRLILVWLVFIGMLTTYSGRLRDSFAMFTASSQLQVNAKAFGALSEVPGANVSARALLCIGAVAVVVFLPSVIVLVASTSLAVASGLSGTGYFTPAGAMAAINALAAAPAGFTAGFWWMNHYIPLIEMFIFAINYGIASLFFDAAVAFLCMFFKLFGV